MILPHPTPEQVAVFRYYVISGEVARGERPKRDLDAARAALHEFDLRRRYPASEGWRMGPPL